MRKNIVNRLALVLAFYVRVLMVVTLGSSFQTHSSRSGLAFRGMDVVQVVSLPIYDLKDTARQCL